MSLRQRLGALAYDWPRFLRHGLRGDANLMRNRGETHRQRRTRGAVRLDVYAPSCIWRMSIRGTHGRCCAARLATWPIVLRDRAGRRPTRRQVSFLIGHRGLERLPNLLATLRSIAGQSEAAIECIVIEQSAATRDRDRRCRRGCAISTRPWRRASTTAARPPSTQRCRSRAATCSSRTTTTCSCRKRYAAEVLARVKEGGQFIDLEALHLLSDGRNARRSRRSAAPDHVATMRRTSRAAASPRRKRPISPIGGFDEDFVGWGGEDLEFWERARAYGRVYEFGYLPLLHLWHRAAAGES